MKKKLMMALVALLPLAAFAGDGTKENPYTVAELNAQKDALATSGATVWVKADLKGLGEDGSLTVNTESNQMAGLFGDATGSFVAYSYQILQGLAVSDLTNTKDLLISVNYGTVGHPHGNSSNPQYATDYEKNAITTAHFSIGEIYGALSLEIKNGFRGYHIASCYVVPKALVAARVNSNYSNNKATINYGYYDGAEEGKSYIINKNTALVLLGYDGTYDFVLSAGYHEQINSNGLNGGKNAGVNTITTADRWHFRFIAPTDKTGFERNGSTDKEVVLDAKDEIYISVVSKENHFAGNWNWETADKKWISWQGKKISDFENHTSGISEMVNCEGLKVNGPSYNLKGQRVNESAQKGVYIKNGKKVVIK